MASSKKSPDESAPSSLVFGRRKFLEGSCSLVVGILFGPLAGQAIAAKESEAGASEAALFVRIEPTGKVHVTCHRSEMGQQVLTSMAQMIVDELDASWDDVVLEQAEGHPRYGDQNTDGSRSVRRNFLRFRQAGAALRSQLVAAAAQRWKRPVQSLRTQAGRVLDPRSGRSLGYGELVEAAQMLPWPKPEDLVLKSPREWTAIGKSKPSRSTPEVIRGRGTFGQDLSAPGMKIAVVARPPVVGGTIRTLDDRSTRKVDGVEAVVRMPTPQGAPAFQPLGGVAVVARDTWAAILGRQALEIDWDLGPNQVYDTETFAKELLETAQKPGQVRRNRGDVSRALEKAKTRIEADYQAAHLAHSAMEPPAALAVWTGDRVTVTGCTQTPQSARRTVAAVCGIPEDKVTIEVSWLGGGFGRKSKPDFLAEAAWIAREVGAPVKVVWTREDDLKHGYYHTISAQHLEAGLDESGRCQAFLHRTVFPPIASTFVAGKTDATWGDLRQGASDTPFHVPHLRLESGEAPAHLRIGWLRSVGNIYHAFAVQSFAAELAHAAGRDPFEYLLDLIGPARRIDPNQDGAQYDNYGDSLSDYPIDTGRMSRCLTRVAELADWSRKRPPGHGLGIAVHRSFLTYVATVVEAAVTPEGELFLPGVWSVMDAGTVVNPDHSENQMEGGTLFGISNALYGEISVREGEVVQSNFPDWRILRMDEAPRKVEVEILESVAPPGGVGEPATPPAAPALANAIFAANGQRVRRLPILGSDPDARLLPGKARR